MKRAALALASGAMLPGLGMRGALGQSAAGYPARPVRIVYPFSAGGSGDVVIRIIADGLGKAWGRPVLVDNRPGAGGMLGADIVAKSAPDGYTLLCTLTNLVQAPALFGKAPYDASRDFVPVAELATSTLVLVVQASVGIRDIKGLLAYIAAQGNPFPYGTYAVGGTGHLLMESFARNTRASLVHVPYKGEAPLLNDLLGGQVPAGIISPGNARQHAGKLRAIAVTGTRRTAFLPEVPTFQEAGVAGLERRGWMGLFAPAGIPAEIVRKIEADVNRVMTDSARARVRETGLELTGSTTAAFAATYRDDLKYWTELIAASGIRLD
ncbi:Bug family tripartite tricarboxylate transporter substrate binding protein [Cupriavidus sp. CP313]